MTEKEREKQKESDEKNEEKQSEKGWETNIEKGEFWSDIGPSDRLSKFVWGGVVLWAGIVFMLKLGEPVPWIASGAGALLLAEVAARLVIPEFRTKPGARMVFGVVLLAFGLGTVVGITNWWPVILIGIGISLLLNHMANR